MNEFKYITFCFLAIIASAGVASYFSGFNYGWELSKSDSYSSEVCSKAGCVFTHNGKVVK